MDNAHDNEVQENEVREGDVTGPAIEAADAMP